MEDDFRPNKFKSMTQIEELQVIIEEDDDDDETVDLDTDFEISSVYSKSRETGETLRASVSMDEMQMPKFTTESSRKGYHDTFVTSSSERQTAQKSSTSMSKLDSKQMMTFSSMQQQRKKKRHAKPPPHKGQNTQGEFHGQATLHTRTRNSDSQ